MINYKNDNNNSKTISKDSKRQKTQQPNTAISNKRKQYEKRETVKPAKYHTNQHYNNNLMGDKGNEKKTNNIEQQWTNINAQQESPAIDWPSTIINHNQQVQQQEEQEQEREESKRKEMRTIMESNGIWWHIMGLISGIEWDFMGIQWEFNGI